MLSIIVVQNLFKKTGFSCCLNQFNLAIPDDKQVSGELKRSLEGKLPEPGQPVCVEILMDTQEVGSYNSVSVFRVYSSYNMNGWMI